MLADVAGEGWQTWLWPLSVDGLIVAASLTMLARKRGGLKAGTVAWISFLAGIGVSLAANVAAAEPTLVELVAAWPPLGLGAAHADTTVNQQGAQVRCDQRGRSQQLLGSSALSTASPAE